MTAEGTRSRDLRRVRRRRTAIWTAAAVAVVVVIVPVTLIGRGSDQRPTPVHPPPLTSVAPEDATGLPQGAPAGVYFLHDGALVEGDETYPTDATALSVAGSTVLLEKVGSRGRGWHSSWSILAHDHHRNRIEPLPFLDDVATVRISPDGKTFAAVTWPDGQHTRITAYDSSSRGEIAHVDLAAPYQEGTGGGQQVTLLGADVQGRYLWVDGNAVARWRTGSTPTSFPVPRAYGLLAGVMSPLGPIVQLESGDFVWSLASGKLTPAGDLSGGEQVVWSADGTKAAYAEDALDLTTGAETPFDLPSGEAFVPIAFESNASVLLDSAGGLVVRCQADTGRCERALDLRAMGGTFVFPTTLG